MPQRGRDSPSKGEHRLMRQINRSLIIDVLRQGQQMSRVELARRTSLSKPTVSAIVEELLRSGLIVEDGHGRPAARGGRPPSLLSLNAAAEVVAGVHFGVHTTHVAVLDGLARVVASAEAPAERQAEAGLQSASRLVSRALRDSGIGRDRLRAVGMALPGLVEDAGGRLVLAPNLGWRDVPAQSLGRRIFRAPAVALNITAAAAWAEGKLGAAVGRRSFAWVYTGSGVGMSLVIEGRRYGGRDGFAGEFGHCQVVEDGPPCNCGRRGCLEQVAGLTAIERRAKQAIAEGAKTAMRARRGRVDIKDVLAAAADGDQLARRLLEDAGAHLGRGVSFLANILNPELVVLGGPLLAAGDIYIEAVRRSLAEHALSATLAPIVPSSLGTSASVLGAALVATEAASPSYRIVSG